MQSCSSPFRRHVPAGANPAPSRTPLNKPRTPRGPRRSSWADLAGIAAAGDQRTTRGFTGPEGPGPRGSRSGFGSRIGRWTAGSTHLQTWCRWWKSSQILRQLLPCPRRPPPEPFPTPCNSYAAPRATRSAGTVARPGRARPLDRPQGCAKENSLLVIRCIRGAYRWIASGQPRSDTSTFKIPPVAWPPPCCGCLSVWSHSPLGQTATHS